ncbi:MAG: TonB-dependent receptor [Muribaculaceae bacterium]|nr:TonB-dependent receptor [Muribaculaceae bacterium]
MTTNSIRKTVLSILSIFCVLIASAQNITLNGVVRYANGEPIIGASIVEKARPTNGTVSDIDGNFTLQAPEGSIIQISYIGCETKELPAKNPMEVVLEENSVMLQEALVVGVGYGTMRKSDLTGAITSVSAKDLKQGIVTSTEQLLQGKIAGLSVTQASSDPTTGSSLRLRGGTSLSASNSPLIVVDGIPGVDINTVQPSEIISMDVLKDASAAAIYGSRGANGVIIVTTNRATESEVRKMSYNGWVSVGTAAKNIDMLSANQWREYVRKNEILDAIDYGADTDWIKELEQTAVSHSHNFSMSTSRKNSGYRGAVTYQANEGIVKHNYMNRLAGSLSAYQYGFNGHLKVDLGINYTYDKYRAPDYGFYGIFNYALNQNPTVPVKDSEGRYTRMGGTNMQNPVEYNDNYYSQQTRHRLLAYAKADVEIISGLHAVANLSYEYGSWQNRYYQPSYAAGNSVGGTGRRQLADNNNYQIEAYLNYNKTFAEIHKLNVMAGYSYSKYVYEGFGASRSGFDTDSFLYNNLGAGNDYRKDDVYSNKGEARLASFYGRVNYSLNSKYLLTATMRADGSSRFGKNHKWGYFPSVALGWRISDENFMQSATGWLDNLKLRLGYGVTGNQDGIGEYKSLALLGAGGGGYYDAATGTWKATYSPSQNANPDLKWESTAQYNIGIDFSVINRIRGTIDLYYKKTSDLLWNYPVSQPPYLYSSMLANVGDLVNKGVELTLSADILSANNFTWNADLTFSYNHQEITSLSNDTFQDLGTPAGQLHGIDGLSNAYTQIVKAGYPTGAFFGPRCSGIDANGEYIIENPDEQVYLGSAQPKFNLGFATTLNWKGFDFRISAYGMFGQKILNATNMQLFTDTRMPSKNIPDKFAEQGIRPDKITYSDYWLENGSFLRLQAITLGYTIPGTKKIGIENLRIYGTVDNVCTLTGYSGVDPEISTSGLDNPGIDLCNVYPKTRSFIFGLNVSF